MRLFVAVVPPPAALDHLSAAVAPVRARHAELQWVAPERWHLTLAFYGEVAERQLARARRRLDRATRGHAPIDLALGDAGHFGCRVLWVGLGGQRDRLCALAGRVAVDGQRYRPHLTVARVRRGADPRAAEAMLAAYDGPGWTAREVLLVRSHLGPKPWHETLASWPLRPSW